jgi:hypothetical protein
MKHFDPQLSGSTVASGSMSIDNHVLPAQDNVYDKPSIAITPVKLLLPVEEPN